MILSTGAASRCDSRAQAARTALLRWYRAAARPLPWRGGSDPYRIWVSEVMLQQTQVATVIPYYDRFLRAFPTVERLARARFEKVAACWSGLGYYRRARHLHLAARKMVEEMGGKFPNTYGAARTLPGVGPYTACAVLSIAYGQPLPVLDGNVARVVARLNALRGNIQQRAFRAEVERYLLRMLPERRPGDFNQAMMELGQTVCLPRAPRCGACPLRAGCLAFRQGHPESYPQPRTRRASEPHFLAAAVISEGGKVALARGLDEDLLGDLWNFPAAFGPSSEEAIERLRSKMTSSWGAKLRLGRKVAIARHTITYRTIRVELYEAMGIPRGGQLRWFTAAAFENAAVSQLARKIMTAWREGRQR
ncbi:MAG: A/G-specific adenine glycosylase [Terriglobia bacterium]